MMKEYYELTREEWIEAINDILSRTNELWIIQSVYSFLVGMTKDEKGGAK